MKTLVKLNNNEMKMILGGVEESSTSCRITVTLANGTKQRGTIYTDSSDPSGVANNECLESIEWHGSGTRCGYDCDYDGWGV